MNIAYLSRGGVRGGADITGLSRRRGVCYPFSRIGVSCSQLEEKRQGTLSTPLSTNALGSLAVLIRKGLQSHVCMLYSTAVYIAWGRACIEGAARAALQ